jgi:LmbE family N-acetylglucosaminyl deacetylase
VTPAVLHLAPHPDDELIGAPATLMALRDAGWRVVNLACGFGSDARLDQRAAELAEACRRAGFELLTETTIAAAIAAIEPAVVVSPTPRDRHPAHVQVARETGEALATLGAAAPRWWAWALWGALGRPTLATRFGAARLEEILSALAAHGSQLRRNDYRRLVRGRAEAAGCLAPELLFGFGASVDPGTEFAELLTEVVPGEEGWRRGAARWLDAGDPLAPPSGWSAWLADPAAAVEGDL